MPYLAYSVVHGRPVIQAGRLDAFERIIREGEYERSLLILCETFAGFDAWHYDMDRIKTGASLFVINSSIRG